MAMRVPQRVRMVEVGPRDGLQNEAQILPAATKIALIEQLADAGLSVIEAGSFVSPKWIPQMADTAAVLAGLKRKAGVSYPVLVPNIKGFDAARAAGVEEIAVFAAASESFSRRNINCSIAESLERFAPVAAASRRHGMRVRGTSPASSTAPMKARSRLRPWRMSRRSWRRSAATRSRSATPSAPARRRACRR